MCVYIRDRGVGKEMRDDVFSFYDISTVPTRLERQSSYLSTIELEFFIYSVY